jgi:hypothetical protein
MGQSPSGSDHKGASPGMALSASFLPMPVVPAGKARPAWAGRERLGKSGEGGAQNEFMSMYPTCGNARVTPLSFLKDRHAYYGHSYRETGPKGQRQSGNICAAALPDSVFHIFIEGSVCVHLCYCPP